MEEHEEREHKAIAVLTGDVVGSTDLSPFEYDELLYSLYNQLSSICSNHPKNKHQVTRGDSFQVIINDTENTIRYAILIRTYLKSLNENFDCRISVGIGSNDAIRHHVGTSTGEAFTLSGRELDLMTDDTLKISTSNSTFNEYFSLLTKYVDHQISEMTTRQCAIAYIKLNSQEPITQQAIAELLNANRVSINRSIKSSKLELIEEYISLFKMKIGELF